MHCYEKKILYHKTDPINIFLIDGRVIDDPVLTTAGYSSTSLDN